MVKKATSSQVSGRSSSTQVNSPSVAIFQWLSYAFWGWTAIATAALVGICTNFVLNGYTSNYEAVAYVVAAAFVLLPIAVVCDVLFSRRERDEKDRVGMVIMERINDFLFEISKLKRIPRTGWVFMGVKNPETVAEHSFRLAVASWIFAHKKGLNPGKAIKIALAHDLCEVYAGDITTFLYHHRLVII